jgi:hypothetical protein
MVDLSRPSRALLASWRKCFAQTQIKITSMLEAVCSMDNLDMYAVILPDGGKPGQRPDQLVVPVPLTRHRFESMREND